MGEPADIRCGHGREPGCVVNKPPPPLITPRLFAWVVGVASLLLIAVIVVGLARDEIDPTGVATVIATLISSVVVGAIVRGKPRSGDS